MFTRILLIQALLSSDDTKRLSGTRSDTPVSQRCYLWNPYSSNNEVSRSFHNYSLSPAHTDRQLQKEPLVNQATNLSKSSTHQTPLAPFCPPLPTETPRSLEEYAKLLPISMFLIVFIHHQNTKICLIHQQLLENITEEDPLSETAFSIAGAKM